MTIAHGVQIYRLRVDYDSKENFSVAPVEGNISGSGSLRLRIQNSARK